MSPPPPGRAVATAPTGSGGAAEHALARASATLLRGAAASLAATALAGALPFGLYILAFYAGALTEGEMARWNGVLPRLYEPETPAATAGLGLHLAAGGTLLVLGGIQLVGPVRSRWPAVHRWVGRVYATAALLAGVGGLAFIALKGAIGGPVMDVGFGLYGALMIAAAVVLAGATGFLLLGTYDFTKLYWDPAIRTWLTG